MINWIIALLFVFLDLDLTWNPSPDPRMKTLTPSGYVLVWGSESRVYDQGIIVGNVTNATIHIDKLGVVYISCYAYAGELKSDFSNEITWTNKVSIPKGFKIIKIN